MALPSGVGLVSLSACSLSSPGGFDPGKSGYALRRASELGPPPWLYVAPNTEGDDDLKARLAGHRRDQEARWKLIEAPDMLASALEPATADHHGAVVIDRFTIWLSTHLAKIPKTADRDFLREIEQFADRLYRSTTPVVLVTTEIGLGFLAAARFPTVVSSTSQGIANQILAERAQTRGVPGQRRPAAAALTAHLKASHAAGDRKPSRSGCWAATAPWSPIPRRARR